MAAPHGNISPFEVLTEETQSDDEYMKINAYKRVHLVAEAMGPKDAEAILLPFLTEKVTADDDEVVMIIAKALSDFPALVESPESLLPLLSQVAAVEETVVRDAAVLSIKQVFKTFSGPTPAAIEMFKNLSGVEWFCSKISAACLFACLYERAESDEQRESFVQQLDTSLASDESCIVRRAVAQALPDIVRMVSLDVLATTIVPMFKRLATDDHNLVRISAIEASLALARGLQATGIDDQNLQHILPIVRTAVEDRSWRVRQAISKDFAGLCKAIYGDGGQRAKETLFHELVPAYAALIQDNETEVRTTACGSYAAFCDLLGVDAFINYLIPCAQALAVDTAPAVRLALSSAFLDLANPLGQEHFVHYFMPLIERFLTDVAGPDIKVRLEILQVQSGVAYQDSKILSFPYSYSSEKVRQFYTLLDPNDPGYLSTNLKPYGHQDDNWRIRKAVVQCLPVIAQYIEPQIFETRLLPHLFSAFKDRVCEVRMAGTQAPQQLFRIMGVDFVQSKVLPIVRALYDESSFYLIRLAVLHAMQSLASDTASAHLLSSILGLLLTAAHDKIANVRFTAAQALAQVSHLVDDITVATQIRPSLQELVHSDPDNDVKYFATLALETCA